MCSRMPTTPVSTQTITNHESVGICDNAAFGAKVLALPPPCPSPAPKGLSAISSRSLAWFARRTWNEGSFVLKALRARRIMLFPCPMVVNFRKMKAAMIRKTPAPIILMLRDIMMKAE